MPCRYATHTVQQRAADGTLLASFSGQPGDFSPQGSVVLQSDGGGAPFTVAVADNYNNAIRFFQRTE